MTELGIGEALLAEVAGATPEQTVRRIKRVAADELSKVDPTAAIRFTEYFNHTFAPDIVLRWTAPVERERYVYLRVSEDPRELEEDITHVQEQQPMMVTLTAPSTPQTVTNGSTIEHLGDVAQESNTLVSDLAGLETLGEARAQSTFVGLLSTTVARGGRGLLTSTVAKDAAASIEAGFAGAQQLNAQAVTGAADSAAKLLTAAHADRLNRFLHAVWLGAGGRADQYPQQVSLGGELDDDSWNFLLTLDTIGDLDFWRRLGRSLTVGQLARLTVPADSENFHNLVKANADQLWVRSCALVDEQPNLLAEDSADQWRWTVERAALALRGPKFICYLAERKAGIEAIETTKTDGVAVAELRERAAGRKITGVVMSDGHEDLDLVNTEGQDVTQSVWLSLLESNPASPKIKKATALLASGHSVNVDFATSTASVLTKSQPSLPVFVGGVVPLLRALDDSESEGLGSSFSGEYGEDLLTLLAQEEEIDPSELELEDDAVPRAGTDAEGTDPSSDGHQQ